MDVMNQKNNHNSDRKIKRTVAKAILMLGGSMLAILSLATPVAGQATRPALSPATQPLAMNAPSGRVVLITDGIAADGKVHLMSNKTTVITTAQPYKSVSIGQPEIADVTPVSPTNILVTAKKP